MGTQTTERPTVLTRLEDLKDRQDIAGQFQDLRGYEVINPTGNEVGEVVDEYVDTKADEVALVALRFHGGGDRPWLESARTVLVPFRDVEVFGARQVRVKRAQEDLAGAPEFTGGDVGQHAEYWRGRQ